MGFGGGGRRCTSRYVRSILYLRLGMKGLGAERRGWEKERGEEMGLANTWISCVCFLGLRLESLFV